jgi:hypothetical protein
MGRSANCRSVFLLGLFAVLAPAVAQASVQGNWTLDMTGTVVDQPSPCVFHGTANLSPVTPPSEFAFSGPCHLDLVSGPEVCPSSLDGQLSANVTASENGLEVSGAIDGGEALGFSTFSGLVVGDPTASGTFSTTSGPFAGFNGTWTGTLGGIVVAVPTLQTAGLVLLAALLALASALILRRRARAPAR